MHRILASALFFSITAASSFAEVVFDWSHISFSQEKRQQLEECVLKAAQCYTQKAYAPYGTYDFERAKKKHTVVVLPLDSEGKRENLVVSFHYLLEKQPCILEVVAVHEFGHLYLDNRAKNISFDEDAFLSQNEWRYIDEQKGKIPDKEYNKLVAWRTFIDVLPQEIKKLSAQHRLTTEIAISLFLRRKKLIELQQQ